MNRNNLRTRFLAILLIAVLAGTIRLVVIQIGLEHSAKTRRLMERSDRLYELIVSATQPASFTSEEIVSGSHNGSPVRHLIVSITPQKDPSKVRMDWDYSTGELIQFLSDVHDTQGEAFPVMREEKVMNMTVSWLRLLGIASKGTRWSLTEGPRHSSNGYIGTYTARWRGADREATITIQDQTGELLMAHIRRLD